MELFLLSIIIVGLCVFALSFNIIFKKNGKFPDKEISRNKHLVKEGLMCAKAQERILWKKKNKNNNGGCTTDGCDSCGVVCDSKK